jgi:hypothetical protein
LLLFVSALSQPIFFSWLHIIVADYSNYDNFLTETIISLCRRVTFILPSKLYPQCWLEGSWAMLYSCSSLTFPRCIQYQAYYICVLSMLVRGFLSAVNTKRACAGVRFSWVIESSGHNIVQYFFYLSCCVGAYEDLLILSSLYFLSIMCCFHFSFSNCQPAWLGFIFWP